MVVLTGVTGDTKALVDVTTVVFEEAAVLKVVV